MDNIAITFVIGFFASCAASLYSTSFLNLLTRFQNRRLQYYIQVHLIDFQSIQDSNTMFNFVKRIRFKICLNYLFLLFLSSIIILASFIEIKLFEIDKTGYRFAFHFSYILIALFMVIASFKIIQIIRLNTAERACKEIMKRKNFIIFDTQMLYSCKEDINKTC